MALADRVGRRPVCLDLPAEPASARTARHAVCELLDGVSADRGGVMLAVSEAVTNAVLHAYSGGSREGRIRVRAELLDHEALDVTVEDDGIGMRTRSDSPGIGLGLPTISALADTLEIDVRSGGGTAIRMRFDVEPA
jgi:serine/threonine-protein kinase RsbW/stage II sporulation protein AB (anti-sigma F factor)